MSKNNKTVTDTLKSAIEASGRTVYQIAKDSGVSQGVISRFLNGERDIRGDTINKLATVLGLELNSKENV